VSNPYTARAAELLKYRENPDGYTADLMPKLPATPMAVQEAQVAATLALAYEQRTENLIAIWQSESTLEGLNYKRLGDEIKERLELNED
jgi:hypothetical protein